AALQAVPAASDAGKILRSNLRASREKTRPASISRAGRDPVAALSGTSRLYALRVLRILRLRDALQIQHGGHGDPDGGKDGPLRDPAELDRSQDRDRLPGPGDRGCLFQRREEGGLSARQDGDRVRKRRGDATIVADVEVCAISAGIGELQRF